MNEKAKATPYIDTVEQELAYWRVGILWMMLTTGSLTGRRPANHRRGMSATLKVTIRRPSFASRFEVIAPPVFDVDAYVHTEGEEMSYLIEGQLDSRAWARLAWGLPWRWRVAPRRSCLRLTSSGSWLRRSRPGGSW